MVSTRHPAWRPCIEANSGARFKLRGSTSACTHRIGVTFTSMAALRVRRKNPSFPQSAGSHRSASASGSGGGQRQAAMRQSALACRIDYHLPILLKLGCPSLPADELRAPQDHGQLIVENRGQCPRSTGQCLHLLRLPILLLELAFFRDVPERPDPPVILLALSITGAENRSRMSRLSVPPHPGLTSSGCAHKM